MNVSMRRGYAAEIGDRYVIIPTAPRIPCEVRNSSSLAPGDEAGGHPQDLARFRARLGVVARELQHGAADHHRMEKGDARWLRLQAACRQRQRPALPQLANEAPELPLAGRSRMRRGPQHERQAPARLVRG